MNHSKIKPGITYRSFTEVIDVIDKGKNALIVARIHALTKNAKGEDEEAFYIDRTTFIRGMGGFGYKGTGKYPSIPNAPERKPDAVFFEKTFSNQAFIYRLSGDINALHIEPSISALAGFERPIIHGIRLLI
jgi:hypothetical protein